MNTINDKVVVILGASNGIGEATVRLLADKGAKLVIASRREEKLRELANSLEECTIAYKAADVASYEEVKAVIDMTVEFVYLCRLWPLCSAVVGLLPPAIRYGICASY